MSIPYVHYQKVFAAAVLTVTTALDSEFIRCPTKVVEIVTTGFSGTLDMTGAVDAGQTYDNVLYTRVGAGGRVQSAAQLSYTVDTGRYRYLVTDAVAAMNMVMTRSAGSIELTVVGFETVTAQPPPSSLEATLLASAARTATSTGADQTNYGPYRLAYVVIDLTAGSGFGLTPAIQGKDSLSGKYVQLHANITKLTGTGTVTYAFGLGVPAAAGGVTAVSGFPLPRVWRLVMTADDATSATYSASVNFVA